MKNEIIKLEVQELNLLEPSKAEKIKQTFLPMSEMLQTFEQAYNDIVAQSLSGITLDICNQAKRLRLDVGKVRIETGKIKDKQKEYIKLEDKAIMGVHNILVWAVKEKEDKLKEIENFFEIQEQKRLELLQAERVEQISPYIEDAEMRDLSTMENDVWDAYFSMKKQQHADRIEAEKQAEIARIEAERLEKIERERIRIENEKLRKQAEEKAIQEKARIAKEQAERKAREEKEQAERKAHESALQAEREKAAKIEREEREKREALEAQIRAKEQAEKQAAEAEKARVQAELAKGDSEKIKDLIADFESLKSKYEFKSEKSKKMYENVNSLIAKTINFININS